jgi:membrane peptidoglycan carboxypeptidase
MEPHIFQKETDAAGQILRQTQPLAIRRVVSEATASTLTDFFEGVVRRGTGKPAAIPGVRIAGKTGTSKRYTEGHYEQGDYTASFVGYFPVEDPQIVCLVMIDNPRGSTYYGGTVSAPVFRSIAQQILSTSEMFAPIALNAAKPAPELHRTAPDSPAPVTVVAASGNHDPIVPNVRGFSVRRAIGILTSEKLEAVVNGSGTVVNQAPPAGQAVKPGMRIVLTCQPKPLVALSPD